MKKSDFISVQEKSYPMMIMLVIIPHKILFSQIIIYIGMVLPFESENE
jgi:hypothetical protein